MKRNGKVKAFVGGVKLRSQHSIFGPVKRVAGPAGGTPRWAASLTRSWNRYELRDIINREKGKWWIDDHGKPIPFRGTPKRLTPADFAA